MPQSDSVTASTQDPQDNLREIARLLPDAVHESWLPVLAGVREQLQQVLAHVESERACGAQVIPAAADVFNALQLPFSDVKVLIIGQDPYPNPGDATGLAFSYAGSGRLPASLRNIFAELAADCGATPATGDLRIWADQGVLLLNTSLTVRAGAPGSHSAIGWQCVTAHIVSALADRETPLVALLWGAHAAKFMQQLGVSDSRERSQLAAADYQRGSVFVIRSAHPSPLSARRGFFGSKPFSRTNEILRECGMQSISWAIKNTSTAAENKSAAADAVGMLF